jgi:UPF0755 protein
MIWAVCGLLVVSLGILLIYDLFLAPPRSAVDQRDVEVIIPEGLGAAEIAGLLEEGGLVDNVGFFLLLGKAGGYERQLQAGRYHLSPAMSDLDVLKVLARGGTREERVTIPEGLTLVEVARVLAQHAGVDTVRFLALAKDPAVANSLGVAAASLEGYLFPDTYNIFWDMDEMRILRFLVDSFHGHFDAARRERAAALGMTVHDVITLASLIEEEAKREEERPVISGVFHNRLALNRPLESCATVKYILPGPKRLTYADLNIPSPYNTYLHAGLPPGPICSPGLSSIDAALSPAESEYLYFVARGDGTHEFTRTVREHNRAKQKYQSDSP